MLGPAIPLPATEPTDAEIQAWFSLMVARECLVRYSRLNAPLSYAANAISATHGADTPPSRAECLGHACQRPAPWTPQREAREASVLGTRLELLARLTRLVQELRASGAPFTEDQCRCLSSAWALPDQPRATGAGAVAVGEKGREAPSPKRPKGGQKWRNQAM